MNIYYVYILKCHDNSYYTGVTNNIERRLQEHLSGTSKSAYTNSRLPLKLMWLESFNDIKNAIATEKQIKGWSRRKKKALIDEDWEKLIFYSKSYSDAAGGI